MQKYYATFPENWMKLAYRYFTNCFGEKPVASLNALMK